MNSSLLRRRARRQLEVLGVCIAAGSVAAAADELGTGETTCTPIS